jgi:hypothetical protein
MFTLWPAEISTRTRGKGWDHSQSETKKVSSLLPWSRSEQERLQILTIWPTETSTRTRGKGWDHSQSETKKVLNWKQRCWVCYLGAGLNRSDYRCWPFGPLKQVQEQEIRVEIISNLKQFHLLSSMWYMNDHTQSIITQACNKNMESQRAWVSNTNLK